MNELIEKMKALALLVGTDIHTIWDEFEAFVKAKFEKTPASTTPSENV